MDQNYFVILSPREKTEIHTAYVEYSAEELRGNVKYVLNETVDKGELYYGNFDPMAINEMSEDEMLMHGIKKVEPWSKEIVYSPTAVMQLENKGIFHPSPMVFLTFGGLGLMFMLYLLVLGMVGTGQGVKKAVRAVKNHRKIALESPKEQ